MPVVFWICAGKSFAGVVSKSENNSWFVYKIWNEGVGSWPGMGFFSIPMAHMVGDTGKIICVDVQDKMLLRLRKRAHRKHLDHIIETWQCSSSSLAVQDQKGTIDFALAFAVVHEIPNQDNLLAEIYDSLKPQGILFVAEPRGHVIREAFDKLILLAQKIGFSIAEMPDVPGSHSVVLVKKPK
jgi:ubiquinone/menaquinone biosynthesis C-methylase UbiE